MRVILEQNDYRIVEILDEYADMDYLKGDCFNPKYHPEVSPDQLRRDELEFEQLAQSEGVFGYVLEKWNPAVGAGWEHVDSCWGFVGPYTESDSRFNHYIVDELIKQIA